MFAALVIIFVELGKRQLGVCIFDIDSIMTKDYKPTSNALYLQQYCLESGHDIAVISPRLTEPQDAQMEKDFLKTTFPQFWTPVLMKSHGTPYVYMSHTLRTPVRSKYALQQLYRYEVA